MTFALTLATLVAAFNVDTPVRRAVRKRLGLGRENKVVGSWDRLRADVASAQNPHNAVGDDAAAQEYADALARTRLAITVRQVRVC